jgi:hypothetical protein
LCGCHVVPPAVVAHSFQLGGYRSTGTPSTNTFARPNGALLGRCAGLRSRKRPERAACSGCRYGRPPKPSPIGGLPLAARAWVTARLRWLAARQLPYRHVEQRHRDTGNPQGKLAAGAWWRLP